MASDTLQPVGSMRTSLWGQVGIDFAVTEDGKVHITFDLRGKHFVGADFDRQQEQEFAQLLVATSHAAAVKRQELAQANAELPDRAAMPGQVYQRPCCDHCNNGEGDPAGHDYVPGGSVHDGPCEQCAAEKARREHDEGTA